VWWALPTRLRAAGVAIEDVTALSALLTLPWAVKFLWAPGVDALRASGVPLRRSIFVAQLAMAATLVPLLAIELPGDYAWLVCTLLLHAVCAATQDVAIDALAVSTLPIGERGGATGWMQAGMLLGRALFGGAALQAEAWVGAQPVIAALIALLLVSSALVALAQGEPSHPDDAGPGAFARSLGILREVARRRATWLGVGFATLGGGGMEAAGTVAGPMLIDRGLSEAAVGRFFAVPAVLAMALGALLGGRLSDRRNRRRVAAWQLLALTGVLLALEGGIDAAEAVHRGLRDGNRRRTFAAYDRSQRRAYRFFRRYVTGFYRPEFRDLLLRPGDPLGLSKAVVTVLAGNARPSLKMRLRLELFFVMVALQRFVEVAPRLHAWGERELEER